MGMHVTIHGKTTESFNGQDGKWVPLRTNSLGQVEIASLAGENATFNRMAAGPIVKYATVSADGIVVTGACIFYGLIQTAAGTMASIYDNTAASGTVVIPSVTATTTFNGMGILMSNGIYADYTSGSWLVLYVDAV